MRYLLLIFTVLFLFALHIPVHSQYTISNKKSIQLFEEAMKLFDQGKTTESLANLHKATEKTPGFTEAWLLLADVYHYVGQTEAEIASYKKAIEINPAYFPQVYINLAESELHVGQYEFALERLKSARQMPALASKSNRIDSLLVWADFGVGQKNKPVRFKPENMGQNLNSPLHEYWPSLTADEQVLVFTVRIPTEALTLTGAQAHQEDFYFSRFVDDKWLPAMPLGKPVNSNLNEGAGCISYDGSRFFFTSCNRPDGVGRCDLYISTNEANRWGVPGNMGVPVNSPFNDKQPSLAPDGKTLFFASNRGGTFGGMDIWFSVQTETGQWLAPTNLGPEVNTCLDDESPFIHPDGKTLYFASKGHAGMGGFDLFLSRKGPDGKWSKPQNLGFPINTFKDETGLVINAKGTTAMYAAENDNGFGGLDLFTFEIDSAIQPLWVTYVKGVVSDALTKKTLEADVWVTRLDGESSVHSCKSDVEGKYFLCLAAGNKYAMNAYKPGYLFYSSHFSLTNSDSINRFYEYDIPLQAIEVGKTMVLRNIFFSTNEFQLQSGSEPELNQLLLFLNQNPLLRVELSGHTDNTGNSDFNQTLSANRAQSVYDWLVLKGVDPQRLQWVGYADSKPVSDNETEEGKAQNRRTEVVILSK